MSKVLYNDGRLAVVDYENDDSVVDERLIKTLLQVDEGNVGKLTRKMLGYRLFASSWYMTSDDVAWQNYALSRADLPALERLGFDVSNGYLDMPAPDLMRCYPIAIPRTERRVLGLAECVQYLGRLHLLSKGDERHADMLPEVSDYMGYMFTFDVVLPRGFRLGITQSVLQTCARFNSRSIATIEKGRSFSVHVDVEYLNVGFHSPADMPKDEIGMKSVAAAALLSSLVNYQATALPFVTDKRTLELRRSDESSIAATMADLIIAGKIGACPHCGRPVLMPRKSSKPFCKPAHQTRYSEKARKMLDSGASVDEVASAYPHIQRETIANW